MTELVKNEGNSFNKSLQKSPETEADEEVEEADENFSTERETDHLPHTLMRLLTCTNLSSAHSLHTKQTSLIFCNQPVEWEHQISLLTIETRNQ